MNDTNRFFCLRFDVDTPACLERGTEPLLRVAEQLNARFTFFINPGRAISRYDIAVESVRKGLPGRARKTRGAAKFSPRAKLGTRELSRLLLSNPRLIPGRSHIVRAIQAGGHEVGLHGGGNHGTWQRSAQTWHADLTASELDRGATALYNATGHQPRAFASPGWNTPPQLRPLLTERGFDILADSHGQPELPAPDPVSGLIEPPTWLAGEPGGVGFLEWQRAQGHTQRQILDATERYLDTSYPLVCLYDHPFFAGVQEAELIEQLLTAARRSGRQIVPLGIAARALADRDGSASQ